MTTTTKRRWHIAVVALGASAMCGLTACGSDADTTDTSATVVEPVNTAADDTVPADTVLAQPDTTEAESIDSVPTDTVPIDTAPVVADTVDDGGSGDASAECGGFTAAEVAAAAGAADFDSADDISVSTDVSCLFSNSESVDGIIIRVAPTKDSTVDGIDGVPVEEALTTIELLQTAFLEDGYTVERVTVGGFPATVITGNDSMQGIPGGMAVTVIDGNAIVAEADGDALSTDAAGFGPIVKAVLELAVAAQG